MTADSKFARAQIHLSRGSYKIEIPAMMNINSIQVDQQA